MRVFSFGRRKAVEFKHDLSVQKQKEFVKSQCSAVQSNDETSSFVARKYQLILINIKLISIH